jgi:hypothetical protein
MKEIQLTDHEISTNYRELKEGEFIAVGDVFQRKAGARTPAETGQPLRMVFERVEAETVASGQKLAGLMYLPSYPVVLRPI